MFDVELDFEMVYLRYLLKRYVFYIIVLIKVILIPLVIIVIIIKCHNIIQLFS